MKVLTFAKVEKKRKILFKQLWSKCWHFSDHILTCSSAALYNGYNIYIVSKLDYSFPVEDYQYNAVSLSYRPLWHLNEVHTRLLACCTTAHPIYFFIALTDVYQQALHGVLSSYINQIQMHNSSMAVVGLYTYSIHAIAMLIARS